MSELRWAAVDDYICAHFVPEDSALEAARAASSAGGLPAIEVSANLGKFLNLLARISGAQKILEIGTLGGYSTIWLARALPPQGRLITLEVNARHAAVARESIARAGFTAQVDQRLGPALEILPALGAEAPFDFIFIDADKENNASYFRHAVKLSRRGSVIVVDNVVRAGKVTDPGNREPMVSGTRKLYDAMAAEPAIEATAIQTVGRKGHDGFAVALVVDAV